MIDHRRAALKRHLEDLRKNDGWHPFQHFVIGLLRHDGYTDVRHSNVRSDLGRDAVAITPRGESCVVAVSFECTNKKVLKDAKRWTEDPNRENATVLLFVTTASPTEKVWSKWKPQVKKLGLELRMFSLDTICDVATSDLVWRETCARLGITGHRPGYRLIAPYDSDLLRQVLQIRPKEWLAERIELEEWTQLGELRNRLILGKPGAGKTTTLFVHLEANRPEKVLVVEPDLRPEKVEGLLDAASGGGVIVFDDAHERPDELRVLLSAFRARRRDVPSVAECYRGVQLLLTARSQEWADIDPPFSPSELAELGLMPRLQINLGLLSREQCRALMVACATQWTVQADEDVLDRAAAIAALSDATPLYVLSMLAPARLEKRLRYEHLNRIPSTVLELWEMYWHRLSGVEQALLRVAKLFALTWCPPRAELFGAAATAFSLRPHEVSRGMTQLESMLWISRDFEVPTILAVQAEAIELTPTDIRQWDSFVFQLSTDVVTRAQIHSGTGEYHIRIHAVKTRTWDEYRTALRLALPHFDALALLAGVLAPAWRASASYSLSRVYLALAHPQIETARTQQSKWLHKATQSVETALYLYQSLDMQGEWAATYQVALRLYLNLASLARTSEDRGVAAQKAIHAGEEAVRIYRALSIGYAVATTLNSVSNCYLEAASLEKTRAGTEGWVHMAINAIEEAIRIFRGLDLPGDLAGALANAGNLYYQQALSDIDNGGRSLWLQKATEVVDEAIHLYREMGDIMGENNGIAFTLGISGRILHLKAKHSDSPHTRLAFLRSSLDAFAEAQRLYRDSPLPTPTPLAILYGIVQTYLHLANNGDIADADAVRATCLEGLHLARTMEDEETEKLFAGALSLFSKMLYQRDSEVRLLQHRLG